MLRQGKSRTTISIYLRALRAIFNDSIGSGRIPKEIYPFGKRKYVVPGSRKVKKALSREQLAALFKAEVADEFEEKARDFWFFSYAANGMNMTDIASLRHEDIEDGVITYYRTKTVNTSKADLRPLRVQVHSFVNSIIDKYGSRDQNPKALVFDIIDDNASPEKQLRQVKNFTRFVNQHLKRLAKSLELPPDISTYWARHSFATNAVNMGASMELVSESLGHRDLKTTQTYFAGFDKKTRKDFAERLMDF